MRTIILLVSLLLMTWNSVKAQKDPVAEPYLDKIAKDLDPGSSLKIGFDYVREDLQTETSIEGEGSLFLSGDNYKIEMEGFVIYFDGEKQYSLNLENEEVYISTPDPEEKEFMFSDPIKLLRSYKKEFKYKVMGETSFQGITSTEIQLYPLELGGPYALLKLFIEPRQNDLKAIQVRHKDGILYSMVVTTFQHIDPLDHTFFQFSKAAFPNVDVIELL